MNASLSLDHVREMWVTPALALQLVATGAWQFVRAKVRDVDGDVRYRALVVRR